MLGRVPGCAWYNNLEAWLLLLNPPWWKRIKCILFKILLNSTLNTKFKVPKSFILLWRVRPPYHHHRSTFRDLYVAIRQQSACRIQASDPDLYPLHLEIPPTITEQTKFKTRILYYQSHPHIFSKCSESTHFQDALFWRVDLHNLHCPIQKSIASRNFDSIVLQTSNTKFVRVIWSWWWTSSPFHVSITLILQPHDGPSEKHFIYGGS